MWVILEYEKLCGISGAGRPSKLRNNLAISQEDIAKQLGTDVRTLQNIKRLSSLSPDLQQIISDGRITPTIGFKVLTKLTDEEQADLIQKLPATQYPNLLLSHATAPILPSFALRLAYSALATHSSPLQVPRP